MWFWRKSKEIHSRDKRKITNKQRSLKVQDQCYFNFLELFLFCKTLLRAFFYFFISKTVYKWIQHGDENTIKNRNYLILSQSVGLGFT